MCDALLPQYLQEKSREMMAENEMDPLHRQVEDLKAEVIRLQQGESDRVQAQELLAESERRLSTLMANLPGMAYRCLNDEFLTMKFVSDGCFDLTGFPPDHLLENHRTNYAELIHPDDRQMVRDKIQSSLERRTQFNLTYRIHTASGKEEWVLEIGQGVFSDIGDLLAIEGFITDITERIKAEKERVRLEDQNRQLQKAESLGLMAGAIAHRFNNLLAVVLGNLEIAMLDLPTGADAIKNLIEAIQAARKAAEVSGLMLTYLGQTRTKADALDLSETCRRSLPMLRAALPKDVVLKADLPSEGPIILANPNQIQQLLTNICTNAWEAVGSNRGAIQLTVKVVPPAEIPATNRFPLDWQPQDMAYACLEVADSGTGIAGKDIEKLFDPFFSSKFTGRGLGLPVVLGVLRAYSGAVAVESKPGRGSVFRAYFPVSTEEVSLQSENPAKALQIKKDGTVLLVEDNDALRRLTDTVLKDLGFNVLATSDGTEAIEVFRQHKEEICFVLCDLTMPLMDGWETITSLRKLSPDIPVILTSGFNEAQVMAGDHPTLPDAFLSKPYVRKELIAAIGQALSVKN
jgi:PAS domain S-box-containing protein